MIKNILLKRLIAWTLCFLLTPVWGAERTTYYHLDLLGSPVAATNSSGQVVWREEYKPYGERTLGQDQSTGAPGYTGKVHEEALGLSYYGARWYDPELGRFTGIDPVGVDENNPHSFNRYAYANNNPYKYTDPDGQNAELAILAGVAAILYFSLAVLPGHEQRADSLRGILKLFNESSEGDGEAAGDPEIADTSSPALEGDPYNPQEVDKRRSKLREELGAPSNDPDSPIPDQGPGRDVGGHSSRGKTPHDTGERNVNRHEEHSRRPKANPSGRSNQ